DLRTGTPGRPARTAVAGHPGLPRAGPRRAAGTGCARDPAARPARRAGRPRAAARARPRHGDLVAALRRAARSGRRPAAGGVGDRGDAAGYWFGPAGADGTGRAVGSGTGVARAGVAGPGAAGPGAAGRAG